MIELVAALAILDFEKATLPDIRQTQHKEFGIKDDVKEVTFSQLSSETNKNIKKRLIQMYLTIKYFDNAISTQIKYQPWAKSRKITKSFLDSD